MSAQPASFDIPNTTAATASDISNADSAVPLKVTIVYDGIEAGRRAMGLVRRMVEQAGEPIHVFSAIWRTDLIMDATFGERVTADAVGADLLVLASAGPNAVSESVERWVGDVLARRRGTPVTLLTMWGEGEDWVVSLYEDQGSGRAEQHRALAA